MNDERLRVGIAGLGGASTAMLDAFAESPHFIVAGGADPNPVARERFSESVGAPTYSTFHEMCCHIDAEVMYIATPTDLHEEQTLEASSAGFHVLVEKPVAASLPAALRMIETAEAHGAVLMVCHKRSADRPILTMWNRLASGDLGRLRSVHRWHFSDWFYRPRRPGELDAADGGVVLRQGSHEFDILRLLAGGQARYVRGWITGEDAHRRGEGSYLAVVDFESGVSTTSVYSGSDHFNSDEFTFGLLPAEGVGASRRRLRQAAADGTPEAVLKSKPRPVAGDHSVYGFTLVSCEGGDMRPAPGGGVWLYDESGRHEIRHPGLAGGAFVVEELYLAVTAGERPFHDGRWGLANLELCLGVRESAASGGPVKLSEQGSVPSSVLERLVSDVDLRGKLG